ncbi:MAG TPA: OmpA family protein [Burkholderiaceae bacterium]|nr:OmpA family protein [Burkholderiaceae bacterium]
MKNQAIALALIVGVVSTGCANMDDTQRGTATGAGIGAAAGAILGATTAGGHRGRSTATGAAVGAGVGALGGYLWSRRMEDQKRQMEQATQGTNVAVTKTADNQLKLNVPSDFSFDSGRADIKPNMRPILDQFASGLTQNPSATVRIIGHTDSTGSDAINDPLSINRASSVRNYLAQRGVDPNRVAIDGRGSREPVADNNSDYGRAQNRRVEIYMGEQQVAQGSR